MYKCDIRSIKVEDLQEWKTDEDFAGGLLHKIRYRRLSARQITDFSILGAKVNVDA